MWGGLAEFVPGGANRIIAFLRELCPRKNTLRHGWGRVLASTKAAKAAAINASISSRQKTKFFDEAFLSAE